MIEPVPQKKVLRDHLQVYIFKIFGRLQSIRSGWSKIAIWNHWGGEGPQRWLVLADDNILT
ncbi:hypothetical protein CRP01_30485 [Flavilitoribacter nigricans DSM 23189 = NBRC 102662]|uniref:Uncharacterized protein n=1 Tax=Flavilitoribacter nigricans (strain ATCC 23147 / DSM 23189 / NBRC 102662 / NCIMB 1420 / SS-2) TaxID=1122177 RepID=A0A2D0N4K4_FLAN2|nr:hypothetical protein CRP01_30485 [Flavilitoribacter nigricans DSM 23189 = NBRC 102662]